MFQHFIMLHVGKIHILYMFFMFFLAAKGHKDCVELLVSSNAPLNGKDKVNVL